MNRILRLITICILSWFGLDAQKPMVTIWIHGTMPSLIVPKFAKHSFFHLEHGLVPINQYHHKDQLYKIAHTLISACPEQFSFDHYYTFGWSGKLSFTERKKAAALRRVTHERFLQYATTLFEEMYINGIVYGNFTLRVLQSNVKLPVV